MDCEFRASPQPGRGDLSEQLRASPGVFTWLRGLSVKDRCDTVSARLGLSPDDPSVQNVAASPVVSLGVWLETDDAGRGGTPADELARRTLHLSDFLEAFGDRLVIDGLSTGPEAEDLHPDFLHAFAGLPLRSYLSPGGYAEVVWWAHGRLRLL